MAKSFLIPLKLLNAFCYFTHQKFNFLAGWPLAGGIRLFVPEGLH